MEQDQFNLWINSLLKSHLTDDVNFQDFIEYVSSKLRKNRTKVQYLYEASYNNYIAQYQKSTNIISIPKPLSQNKPIRQYMDGVFDITHSGHMNAFRRARSLCDILVVGVASDAEVTQYKNKPLMNVAQRAKIAKACKWVDEVHTNSDPNYGNLKQI